VWLCRICWCRCDYKKKFCPFEVSEIRDAVVSVIIAWAGRSRNRGSISLKGKEQLDRQLETLFFGDKTPLASRYSFQHNFTLKAVENWCLYLVGIAPSTFSGKSAILSNGIPYFTEISLNKMV
jgi:hypothetical protein